MTLPENVQVGALFVAVDAGVVVGLGGAGQLVQLSACLSALWGGSSGRVNLVCRGSGCLELMTVTSDCSSLLCHDLM